MSRHWLTFNRAHDRSLKPIKCQCCTHVETSQLIFTANQLTGFYVRATMVFNGLSIKTI